jgi:hypothetical protein
MRADGRQDYSHRAPICTVSKKITNGGREVLPAPFMFSIQCVLKTAMEGPLISRVAMHKLALLCSGREGHLSPGSWGEGRRGPQQTVGAVMRGVLLFQILM